MKVNIITLNETDKIKYPILPFYPLQEHTMVGRSNAPTEQDIQLSGLGITAEHCVLDIDHNDVYITPLEGARYDIVSTNSFVELLEEKMMCFLL